MLRRLKFVLGARAASARDRAEDPGAALDFAYQKQMELLQQVRAGVTQVAAARNQLELQARRLEAQLVKLESEARQALSAGQEDAARRALEVKIGVQQQLRDLDPQLALLRERQQQLTRQQQELAEALARFRAERTVQKARYDAAQSLVKIGEASAGIGTDMAQASLAVRRAQEKTQQAEARAAALDELVESGVFADTTPGASAPEERELESLADGAEVEAELEHLRHELGRGDADEPAPA
jgi:phage shock protein A